MGRYRIVKCTPEVLISLCKNGILFEETFVTENALPDDAKCVRIIDQHQDERSGNLYISIVVESVEFDDVPEGEKIPMHPDVVFERRTKE